MATPSFLLVPDRYKAAKLYSQLPEDGSGDLDVTRATTAYRLNANGILESVANNVPRLDYPASGGCPALLVEPAATNLLLRSEEFDNAYWTSVRINPFGSGSVANAAVAPDGTTSADYIQQLSGETSPGGSARIGVSVTSGTVYTLSVFAKQSDNSFLRLGFALGAGGSAIFCNFDLQSGTIGTPAAGISPSIQNFGNGWYRCSVTATSQVTGVQNQFIYQANGLNSTTATPNIGIFIWGAQLETGSVATSYIPTVSTTQTRNADVISKTGASALIGQTEGWLYAEVDTRITGGSLGKRIVCLNDGAGNTNRIEINKGASDALELVIVNAGVSQALIATANSQSGVFKIAAAYANNDAVLYVNGVQVGVDASVSIPATNQINISSRGSGDGNFNDRIRAAAIGTTRISNAELAALTTL